MKIVAYIVSDAAGYYVARYINENEADAHAGELDGSAVGVELSDGCITFER